MTTGELIYALLGRPPLRCPPWPPDVFAVAATLLTMSGTYSEVVEIGSEPLLPKSWPETCAAIGARWRTRIDESDPWNDWVFGAKCRVPGEVRQDWRTVTEASHVPFDTFGHANRRDVVRALMRLVGYADCASAGIGLGHPSKSTFHEVELIARIRNQHRSCCREVDASMAQALPKQHTSQRGMTVRSLTHHLALLPHPDLAVRWFSPYTSVDPSRLERLNILCLPWPLTIERQDFVQVVPPRAGTMDPSAHRYFTLKRASTAAERTRFRRYLEAAYDVARATADQVDLLVLPELALDLGLVEALRAFVERRRCHAICGVSLAEGEVLEGQIGPANISAFLVPKKLISDRPLQSAPPMFIQRKHHRWCLDRGQVVQYGLAGILPPSLDLWERIVIGQREALFHTISEWLTFTVLICEDLARQDPLASTIRAIGPNLVFALLMDGPQLRHRWGPRYAAALAEDPGSSVLILTSMGMSRLSTPRETGAPDRSRVVGLWKDVTRDVELELEQGASALLLYVERERRTEYAADGRPDGAEAYFPILRDHRSLAVPLASPPPTS